MDKILILGGGGREHALAVFLYRSRNVEKVFPAPGNAGTDLNVDIDISGNDEFTALVDFVKNHEIDLTIAGPEAPICRGVADVFEKHGLNIFSPSKAAARLEGDKAFAREFMKKHRIPHPDFMVFDNQKSAKEYLASLSEQRIVIKASGLAAGKGVLVCENLKEAGMAVKQVMVQKSFGSAGEKIVIEEFMQGEEASILALCDGRNALYFASSQDHKRIYDGDKGPNTGGMGAYAPAPVVTPEVMEMVDRTIIRPALKGMEEEGFPYKGCLYAGLMISNGIPRVVEFNCRFGDPETQVVLPLLESDLYELLLSAAKGNLEGMKIKNRKQAACCVAMASGGYPGKYEKGMAIHGFKNLKGAEDLFVFHAGTTKDKNGECVTSGGRVLGVTGVGDSIKQAVNRAYEGVEKIRFNNHYFRTDIGYRALREGKR